MSSETDPSIPSTLHSDNIPMIYIVGNSFCGSTLFGFLLSANPQVVFIGELKIKTWLKDRSCSCGNSIPDCPFYGDYFTSFNDQKKIIFEDVRPRSLQSLLFNRDRILNKDALIRLENFYAGLSARLLALYPNTKYIVDSSKSIWMLNGWLHTKAAKNIKIIWLTRPLKPSISSFTKRGFNFYNSLLSVLVNNQLTKFYLKKNNIDYLKLDYTRFHDHFEEVAQETSAFIGLDIPVEYHNHFNHHVISGNSITKKAFTDSYKGLHKDEEWKLILTKGQKWILSWFE